MSRVGNPGSSDSESRGGGHLFRGRAGDLARIRLWQAEEPFLSHKSLWLRSYLKDFGRFVLDFGLCHGA